MNIQVAHLERLQQASRENKLVVFVGAGVSVNSGIPAWPELIAAMKEELPDSLKCEKDDLKVAQLYLDSRGRKEYKDKVKEILKLNKTIPNSIHKCILALNPCHIITTNYDDLLEQEIKSEYKQFDVIREDKDMPRISYPNTLVKMHGDFIADNFVLTESDYFDYAKRFPLVRSYVMSLFSSKVVLFVGFSFTDLNLKMILNELRSILEENMQRTYLLSCSKPDEVTLRYYEKKGINVVFLEEKELELIAPKLNSQEENELKKLRLQPGKMTYKVLRTIRVYDPDRNMDLLDYLYKRIESYRDQIHVFGEGLKYLFPPEKREVFHFYHAGLQLGSPYFSRLKTQVSTKKGLYELVKSHPDVDFTELRRFAYYHYLFWIDGVRVLSDMFLNHIDRYFVMSGQYYLNRFDFERFNNRMAYLSSRDLDCSIDDLEYPFLLCRTGDFYGAYCQYNKILTLAWERQKFILYFICLYNVCSIKNGISFQSLFSTMIDLNSVVESIDAIDLEDVLGKLPIDQPIKFILQDLLSFRSIGDSSVRMGNLKEQIHRQRKLSERGGASVNSNINSLIISYHREYSFCNENYIVCDNNRYFESLSKSAVVGILNSYSTIPGKIASFESTRLEKIDLAVLFVLLSAVDTKELSEIIKQYEIGNFVLTEDAVSFVNLCLRNLGQQHKLVLKQSSMVNRNIGNLLLLISKVDDARIDSRNVYKVVMMALKTREIWIAGSLLSIVSKHEPTIEEAITTIDLLLDYRDYIEKYSLFELLSAPLKSKHEKTESVISRGDFYERNDLTSLIPLFPLFDEHNKTMFLERFNKTTPPINLYLKLIVENGLVVEDSIRFESLLKKMTHQCTPFGCVSCYQYLSRMKDDDMYTNVHEIIDVFMNSDECMKFCRDKADYRMSDSFNPEWALSIPEKTRKRLSKKTWFRDSVKGYITSHPLLSMQQRKALIDML